MTARIFSSLVGKTISVLAASGFIGVAQASPNERGGFDSLFQLSEAVKPASDTTKSARSCESLYDDCREGGDQQVLFNGTRYTYFSGCSNGGRQGQAEIQRFPNDYDGVLSGSPAINWVHFAAAESWGRAVMKERRTVPQCKLDAAYRAAVDARGSLDDAASFRCTK